MYGLTVRGAVVTRSTYQLDQQLFKCAKVTDCKNFSEPPFAYIYMDRYFY